MSWGGSAAHIVRANPIIGVDIRSKGLEIALELGTTHVTDITGSGVDYVVKTTGNWKMHRLSIDVLNPHGTVALLTGAGGTDALPEGRRTVGII
jgi:aryl-alcohol dehydrogenase